MPSRGLDSLRLEASSLIPELLQVLKRRKGRRLELEHVADLLEVMVALKIEESKSQNGPE